MTCLCCFTIHIKGPILSGFYAENNIFEAFNMKNDI